MRFAAFLLLASLSGSAQVINEQRLTPDIPRDVVWLDQGAPVPHAIKDYRGRVLLIDFWEYTCINCIRDFAVVKRWYRKYHPYGFEVIGIHFGEFPMGHNADNVARAARRLQLPWPVVADVHGSAWRDFASNVWPNRYLIDPRGLIQLQIEGEGNNRQMEQLIHDMLARTHGEVKQIPLDPDEAAFAPRCGNPTQETYVGDWYGRGAIQQSHKRGNPTDFNAAREPKDGGVVLAGLWRVEQDGATSFPPPPGQAESAALKYHARSLYAVLSVAGVPSVRVEITQDGQPLTSQNAGKDVVFDGPHSYLDVSDPRMYELLKNPAFSQHSLLLKPQSAGFTLHSFTYGNDCQQDFDQP
jgi:hypothetical protein